MRKRWVALIASLLCLILILWWRPWQDRTIKDIYVDCSVVTGKMRAMQGVNAGPSPSGVGPERDFSEEYRELGVNYVRIHDFKSFGDIDEIFPDFNADPGLVSSYNFTSTDEIIAGIKAVGAEVVFRLGYSWTLSSGAKVTFINESDHDKWAEVAKHVIMHYNDGWANGFHYDIKYWEVWNEPDFNYFWTGTPEQYYRLYETTAKAIKAYNASLKVGGPTAVWINYGFIENFLNYCATNKVPLDFVSWHHYYPLYQLFLARLFRPGATDSLPVAASKIQGYLNEYGFNSTESLLTEWNLYTNERGTPLEHAAYAASGLIYLQDTTIAIANYYRGDAAELWGLFNDDGSWKKQAYAFKAFKIMLETPNRLSCTGSENSGYATLAGKSEDNRSVAILISDLNSWHPGYSLTVKNLPWCNQPFRYERYVLDKTSDLALVESSDLPSNTTFTTRETMKSPSFQLIILTAK